MLKGKNTNNLYKYKDYRLQISIKTKISGNHSESFPYGV